MKIKVVKEVKGINKENKKLNEKCFDQCIMFGNPLAIVLAGGFSVMN